MPPLGGALFCVAGRHPVALLGVMFASLLPYALDIVLAGLSETPATPC